MVVAVVAAVGLVHTTEAEMEVLEITLGLEEQLGTDAEVVIRRSILLIVVVGAVPDMMDTPVPLAALVMEARGCNFHCRRLRIMAVEVAADQTDFLVLEVSVGARMENCSETRRRQLPIPAAAAAALVEPMASVDTVDLAS